jgi:hypothetical protein
LRLHPCSINSTRASELLTYNTTGLNYGHGQVSGYLSDIRLHNLGHTDGGDVVTSLFNSKCVLGLLTKSDITESNDDHGEMPGDLSCVSEEEMSDDDNCPGQCHNVASEFRADGDDSRQRVTSLDKNPPIEHAPRGHPSMCRAHDDDPHHGELTTRVRAVGTSSLAHASCGNLLPCARKLWEPECREGASQCA